MNLRGLLVGFAVCVLLWLSPGPAFAEYVIEAWRGGGFNYPYHVSVNPTDGSCWVADTDNNQVVDVAEDGTELWRGGGFLGPHSVSVNPTDGSCWVADSGNDQVVHLAQDGTELWRGGNFLTPQSVCVNPTDGSCWVADHGNDQVVHLAEDGTELWRGGSLVGARCVSVNETDGSCWVIDGDWADYVVAHLAEDGTELWRRGGLGLLWSVSVNPADGSCWVADYWNDEVLHLSEYGGELWRGAGLVGVHSVSVNPADGSCWVAEYGSSQVAHLAEDGTQLWRGGGFYKPFSVSVNRTDGSCWVADTYNDQVVHLVIYTGPPPTFDDVPPDFWAFDEIEACADAGIVGGYTETKYEPAWPVSRDQMAVFISRSICTPTGEAGMADYVPPDTPSFSDVPTDYWAYKYIEYAAEHNTVGGYEDGSYHPEYTLDRGQMAVFIARAMAGDDQSVPDPTGDPSFPDVPADFWSYRHIEYIADQEVAGGYFDGLYHPENYVTRDQMAVFITRAFGLTM